MKKITLFILLTIGYLGFAQNDCSSAIIVTSGNTYTVGTINGATNNVCNWDDLSDNGEWYEFTATTDGVLILSSNLAQNDPDGDTRVSIFTGTCGSLTCVGAADDLFDTFLTEITVAVDNGVTYYILWDDVWSADGFDFTVTEMMVDCPDGAVPFSTSFDNEPEFLACWDFIDDDGDGQGWYISEYDQDNNGILDGNPMLASNSWNFGILNPDNWLISYPVDLSSYSSADTIDLTWDARGIDPTFADENYSVYVSTGNNITDFTSSSVSFNEIIGQNGGAGQFVSRSLDISSLAGNMVYIAFRHWDVSDEFILNIDNVTVDVTLGLADLEEKGITMNYDSDRDLLTLKNSKSSFNKIEIYNTIGQLSFSSKLSRQEESVLLNELANGIYYINIASDNFTESVKFLKY